MGNLWYWWWFCHRQATVLYLLDKRWLIQPNPTRLLWRSLAMKMIGRKYLRQKWSASEIEWTEESRYLVPLQPTSNFTVVSSDSVQRGLHPRQLIAMWFWRRYRGHMIFRWWKLLSFLFSSSLFCLLQNDNYFLFIISSAHWHNLSPI